MAFSQIKRISRSSFHLAPEQIDLWFFSLEKERTPLHPYLSVDETERAERFHFSRHRRHFRNARGLLRLLLSRYLHCDAQSLVFKYGRHGKPEIAHHQQLEFNLSHTADWALIAIGQQNPLGVDLERYSARPYEGIARHAFSVEEQKILKETPAFLKPWLFFRVWAQKEAFIKACGLGLAYPTQEFNTQPKAQAPYFIQDNRHQRCWSMQTFMPTVGIAAALCHHPEIRRIHYIDQQAGERLLFSANGGRA